MPALRPLIDLLPLLVRRVVRDERGATAVEYGLMVALIAAVIIGAVIFLGNQVSDTFNDVGSAVASPSS